MTGRDLARAGKIMTVSTTPALLFARLYQTIKELGARRATCVDQPIIIDPHVRSINKRLYNIYISRVLFYFIKELYLWDPIAIIGTPKATCISTASRPPYRVGGSVFHTQCD